MSKGPAVQSATPTLQDWETAIAQCSSAISQMINTYYRVGQLSTRQAAHYARVVERMSMRLTELSDTIKAKGEEFPFPGVAAAAAQSPALAGTPATLPSGTILPSQGGVWVHVPGVVAPQLRKTSSR